nr:type II toxin-antitoxin system HipA family toxin YjjJ [uncultured Desulfobulbus sp.]
MPQTITEYLKRGPATSKEIQLHTGLSQAAVSRQLKNLGESVIRFQNGRTPRYALTRNAFGGNDKLPLGVVDAHGNTDLVAYVRPLAHGGFFVEPETAMPSLLLGESGKGIYDDLPYFLMDLCPQGFLGRQLAKAMANQNSDFPSDPRRWRTGHIGRYLVSNGEDLPGNFKFGEQALLRVRRRPVVTSEDDYPGLADGVMSGEIPGSSAGGEQPKFTAFCGQLSAHVIVKFSPKGTSDVAQRWRDILITEFHATEAMRARNFSAAETRLIELDGRFFLESQRFDRAGEYGRMSMVSLASIDAEFTGLGRSWPHVLHALFEQKLVSWQHLYDATFLWQFGQLIHNTDMHLGNLSMAIEGEVFRLLPFYDMCSMGFAPKSGGEVQPYAFSPIDSDVPLLGEEVREPILKMAWDFWDRVATDSRISDEFKRYLEDGNPIDRIK